MRIRKRYIWTVLFVLYMAAVAYLCFMKPDDLPEVRPDIFGIPMDKIAHFLMFFPYPIVAYGMFRGKDKKLVRDLLYLGLAYLTGLAMAMATEQIQGLLEYRSYDINDFKADLIGMSCSASAILIYILATIKQRIK